MTHDKCPTCGNRYHWHHAFAKFGYDDGDGDIQSPKIARILENAGYTVHTARFGPHNTIITSIRKNERELMPLLDPVVCIGYVDPATYLPQNILFFFHKLIADFNLPPTKESEHTENLTCDETLDIATTKHPFLFELIHSIAFT